MIIQNPKFKTRNPKLLPRIFSIICILICIAFINSNLFSQSVQGYVLDKETNEPVRYANISIKNTATGTTTDNNGYFEIITKNTDASIIISHINYHKQTVLMNDALLSDGFTIYLEPKAVQITDVVVSAGLYEQSLDKITRSVGVISHPQLINKMNSNMIDILSSVPGFTQVWEYHSPIILRGLNSNRIVIMKDGNRRIGTFPGGYFAQDMNIYDAQRIEIIKGPGSVIYGSGAISGIINVISNQPFGEDKTRVKLISGYGSNNNEFLEMAKVCYKKKNFGISVNGKYRKTGNMIYGDGETAANSNVEDHDIAINTGYRISNKHTFLLNANYHYGDWGKPRGFNGPTKAFTKIRNKEENIHTDFSYSYTPGSFIESVNLSAYYDDGWRDYYKYKYSEVSGKLSSLDLVHYKSNYGGARFYSVLAFAPDNKLTIGADGYIFRLDNPTDVFDYYNDTEGIVEGYTDAGQQNYGVFINNEWQTTEKLRLVAGIRFDVAEVEEGESSDTIQRNENRNAVSGNFGMVFSPRKNIHLSFNAGRAFRMPTAEELFTTVISCKGTKVGNPDLEPEYSWNFDLGCRGVAAQNRFKYDIALFYNLMDDFINEAPDAENEDIDFSYTNTDAVIWGGEVSAYYRFNNVFKASNSLFAGAGASYVYGIDLPADDPDEPLFGIPPFKTTAGLNYKGTVNKNWLTGYSIKCEVEYAAAQNRIASVPEGTDGGPWGYEVSDAHTIFNISAALNSNTMTTCPKLRLIVNNVFNLDYQPFGSYIPAMGRNIKILLSLNF